MKFAGIDIGAEKHVVALVAEDGTVEHRSTAFAENADGYAALRTLLGEPRECLVVMEATGHYWQNLFAFLAAEGFAIALINPLRTRRFAEEDLVRTKTDAIDAVGIARFAQQKRPPATRLDDEVTVELRELVHLRGRLGQKLGDEVRHLHRLVDLGFPEFTKYVKSLDGALAVALLAEYPTAAAYDRTTPSRIAKLCYDGVHKVGPDLAKALFDAARVSVGRHHGEPYQLQVRYACEDIAVLRQRLKSTDEDIARVLEQHEVGRLLTTIDGIATLTSARIIAAVGDPASMDSADALASYVGCIPGLRHSGKRTPMRAGCTHLGNAELRRSLWMPVLNAVRSNRWLRAFYDRLRAAGKLPKVALIAAMRKLLHAVYSVAKHRRPFVPALPAGGEP